MVTLVPKTSCSSPKVGIPHPEAARFLFGCSFLNLTSQAFLLVLWETSFLNSFNPLNSGPSSQLPPPCFWDFLGLNLYNLVVEASFAVSSFPAAVGYAPGFSSVSYFLLIRSSWICCFDCSDPLVFGLTLFAGSYAHLPISVRYLVPCNKKTKEL